jgi:hypothetical protein
VHLTHIEDNSNFLAPDFSEGCDYSEQQWKSAEIQVGMNVSTEDEVVSAVRIIPYNVTWVAR